jgi:hypothetical protein
MSLRSKDRYATVEEFWQAICRVSAWHPQTGPLVPGSRLPALADAEISRFRTHKLARQKDKSTGRLHGPRSSFTKRHVYAFKKPLRYTLYALLACIMLGGAIASFLFYSARSSEKTTTPETACIAEDLTPVAGNSPRDFPALATCYAGTISILGISNSKTNLFLFHIRQSQGVITGDCNGFGTIGTFSGSVTRESTISFTVKLQNQERLLHFEGVIGSAGELVLSYSDLDQNGHKMHNEYGAGRLQAFTALDLTPTVSADGQA